MQQETQESVQNSSSIR